MQKGNKNKGNRVKVSKLLVLFSLFLFIIICFQLVNLSLSETVNGIDLKRFASNRNTNRTILPAYRGSIFTADGEPLAQTIDSYTVIAYLDERRSEGFNRPQHVVDPHITAKALAQVLEISEERLLELLTRENLYQVELGPGGKDISELKKEQIQRLQLSGIDFIPTYRRYYPNKDFLSYTLGYVQKHNEIMIGEMGIEKYYDEMLKGEDGSLEFQQDLYGYKIPNTPEIRKEAIDGMDIYLTIDGNIQMFVERIVKNTTTAYNPDWMLMIVADAKTGQILGTSSTPSFNPNTRNIDSYLNPLVSYAFEPGSTMKTFTYMAALEKGTYDGEATFYSGNKTIGEYTIYDWNREGWGTINYDRGYAVSSNVGASYMMEKFMDKNDLKNYYQLLGFGERTNFTLPGELNGKIDFNYRVEVANAAFGQGITITPIQYIQALTSIANNGVMLKPYIVDKIVDPNTTEIIYQGAREEIKRVASENTVEKMKELMHNTIESGTGGSYKIEGYDIIGKTGTAQYVNPQTGLYFGGTHNYIRSFAGMFPKEDPEIMIYTIIRRPSYGRGQAVVDATKKLIDDIAKYLNIYPQVNNDINEHFIEYTMPNLINNDISLALENLSPYKSKIVVIGDGDKIINQSPRANLTINNNDMLFIVTNGHKKAIPNMRNWSQRNVITFCNYANIECELNGYGYVYNQNIINGEITDGDKLIVDLQIKIE